MVTQQPDRVELRQLSGQSGGKARASKRARCKLLTQQRHCPAFYVAARSESQLYQNICLSRYDAVSSAAGGVAR
jgi:hypothetical protein